MKKTFLLMAALLIMSSAAFAGGGLGIALGPKVGYQTAKLSYAKADIKSDFSNHFTAGIFGRVNIGGLYIQPEVLYFKTSNVFDVTVTGTGSTNLFNLPTGADATLTLNAMNLQVPILIGYGFDLGPITLRGQVGPTANFTLSSKTLAEYSIGQSQQTQQEIDNNNDFDTKAISWGLQAGVGVDLFGFTLDINYNFGLSNVFKNLNNTALGETFDFTNIDNTKQNLFMVTIGYKLINIGK